MTETMQVIFLYIPWGEKDYRINANKDSLQDQLLDATMTEQV